MKLNYKITLLPIAVATLMAGCVYRPPVPMYSGCQGYSPCQQQQQAYYSPATISPMVPVPKNNCCQSAYRTGCNVCY
jgi:hypothetical protein